MEVACNNGSQGFPRPGDLSEDVLAVGFPFIWRRGLGANGQKFLDGVN